MEKIFKETICTAWGKGTTKRNIFKDEHGYFIKSAGVFESVEKSKGKWFVTETPQKIYDYRINKYK